MSTKTLLPILLLATAWLPARQVRAQDARLSGKGTVSYVLVHKFHKVTGVSRMMDVRATVDGNGLKVMARAPVASFDSGNANRDEHALEVLDAAHFPLVTVRAALPGFKMPTHAQKKQLRLDAQVALRGVAVTHPIDVTVDWKEDKRASVAFSFDESLTAHKIERPSLFFVPVDDLLKINGQVNLAIQQ
jgi:polyisoprenoid-binding protein YceI